MRGGGQQPIIVLSQGTKRESGHQVQLGNISACKVIFSNALCMDPITQLSKFPNSRKDGIVILVLNYDVFFPIVEKT